MSESVKVFLTTFEIIYREEGGALRGRSSHIHHAAPDLETAVIDALRFYEGRVETDKFIEGEPYWSPLGSMVTASYTIGQIGPKGEYETRHGFDKFEWKTGTPWSLAEEVAIFTKKMES